MREQRSIFSNIDWITILIYLALVVMGLINIYAAVYNDESAGIFDTSQRYGKQAMMIVASLVVGISILIIDPKFFPAFSWVFYGIVILLLVAVLVFGTTVSGARSWFQIGGFALQPAEFAKFATLLALARFLSGLNVTLRPWRNQFIAAAIIALPMLLILIQNDTGSALVFLALILLLYREGLPGAYLVIGLWVILLFILAIVLPFWPLIIGLSVIAVLAGLFIYFFTRKKISDVIIILALLVASAGYARASGYIVNEVLADHQRMRIMVLLNLADDPKGAGYNVMQSKNAIGSGGLTGKGFLNGTLTKGDFVPEQSTDFIFCTVGEEWGFLGTALVVLLYFGLLMRLVFLAERQRMKFARIYGYGVASILFFHFLVNIGMTIGLLPIIGIPLPFFSYGGSSLLAFTILLFIFLRQDANRMNVL